MRKQLCYCYTHMLTAFFFFNASDRFTTKHKYADTILDFFYKHVGELIMQWSCVKGSQIERRRVHSRPRLAAGCNSLTVVQDL